jgi:hypothetical protein
LDCVLDWGCTEKRPNISLISLGMVIDAIR